jgi:uncharacterized protein (DUF4415 family)
MSDKPMKRTRDPELTPDEQADLAALAALADEAIDLSDAPEVREWGAARRGLFYRPIKQQVTLRLDRDLLDWFKRQAADGERYQTRINRALREYVERHRHSA